MSTDSLRQVKAQHDHLGRRIGPGTPVEVRNQLSMGWAHGFEVATAEPEGYRLRRVSDGSVLPALFAADSLRPHQSV